MSKIAPYFDKYGESHQNETNKLIHWVCVPAIFFSIMGLLYLVPFPIEKTWYLNWASLVLLGGLIFYLFNSISIFLGFLVIGILTLKGIESIVLYANSDQKAFYYLLFIFVIAWIGQFIGHKIEGKKPSFLDDLRYLLVGPAWLLHFIYKKLGIPV
ncbi:MAG TPA: Mpo1-like protein [Saprospiraceae bacterium]|nr:Mpo1-like protein [Saprospiraceae bacterium]